MTQAFVVQTELGHLSAAISGGATTIVLVGGEGVSFDTDLPYDIMIGGDGGEVISLTAIATDTLTVSATASAWPEGTAVFMIATLSQPRTSGQIALVSDIASAGGGDVSGPGSSIDRAIPSWNGTGGTTLRSNSAPIIASDWRITSLTDPTGAQDAATKAYVDANDGVAGGSDPQVQWNNGGALDGAALAEVDADGRLVVGEVASTTALIAPSSGIVLASRYRAGMDTPGWLGRRGREFLAQRNLLTKPTWWFHRGNSSVNTASDNLGDFVSSGTGQTRNVSATAFGQHRRWGTRTGTGSNVSCGIRTNNVRQFFRDTSAGVGGFFWAAIWGTAVHQSPMRAFAGLQSIDSFAPVTGDPSAQLNCCAFMHDSGETEYRFGTNDGAGTCTRTASFGANFPSNTDASDMYLGMIYCEIGVGTPIYYSLENLITGNLAEGSVNTDLPVTGTMMGSEVALGNSSSGAAVDLDISLIYCSMEI